MLIQKLAYIAHGWNLAINGQPLIAELPEAWDNGPVYREIWNHIRDNGYRGPNCTLVDPQNNSLITATLAESEKAVIDHVWNKYKNYSADDLSRMTHEPDTPWSRAYFERGRNASLSNQQIRDHYLSLAAAGRDQ
ncbi:MAG: SocA family protein [Methylobacterium sp.]|nr:SocA family protein [Methylobacterium sp.]MCA3650479.1 SocA family protein [Methylobacterium sp.]MCA4923359.1 SocA family protein [Methylobacterium sp.]